MIRERHRAHPQLGRTLNQPVDSATAVEQTVVRVDMKVDEIFVSSRQGAKQVAAESGARVLAVKFDS